MYEEMGKLLSSLVYKFIKNTHPYKSSVETLELKLIEELVKFDVTKKKHVRSSIDIGMKAKILFNSPLLSNDAKKNKVSKWMFIFLSSSNNTFAGTSAIPCLTSISQPVSPVWKP